MFADSVLLLSAADTDEKHHKPLLSLHVVAFKVSDIWNVLWFVGEHRVQGRNVSSLKEHKQPLI